MIRTGLPSTQTQQSSIPVSIASVQPSTPNRIQNQMPVGGQITQHSLPISSGISSNKRRQQSAATAGAMQHLVGSQQINVAVDGANQMPGQPNVSSQTPLKKKRKAQDKILPPQIRELVPESQAYMDLLSFERKLDETITRKHLDIQEAIKRPMKVKRKLRIYVSNTFYPAKEAESESEEPTVPSWELRVEGSLRDDTPAVAIGGVNVGQTKQPKRKFSSFFKSLVIELDKNIYGPDNHLVEWHRQPDTNETDGFQVKRPGDRNVKCTILLLLDYQPMKFKLDARLARLLGVHTDTRPKIIEALWQYIKTHRLQDQHERDYINCDRYMEQIFQVSRMRFMEIPQRLHALLNAPDPIVINHSITVESIEPKRTACYDIDVEIDDPLKGQMSQFLMSQQSQQEILTLDNKIVDTVEQINQLKMQREFFLGFADDPKMFVSKWLLSQSNDLKIMTDVLGNPDAERRAQFYQQPWVNEAVQQRKNELEQNLGIKS